MTFSFARRQVAFLAVVLCASAAAATARAADDDSTPVSVLIGDAVSEYEAGHYQEARALFRQAHERLPTARTLRGIGMASFELRDYVEAVRALTASLRDQRRPLTAEQKRHAEALLARAHTFVGRYTMKLQPAGSSLFVDGHPAELEPDNVLLLSFGRHQLSLRCASCAPAELDKEVDVAGGERRELELALSVAPPPPPRDTSGGTAGAGGTGLGGASGGTVSQSGGGDSSAGSAHIWFTGVAIAAALGAGASALYWNNRVGELETCRDGEDLDTRCTTQTTIDGQRKAAMGATIGLGAAAVVSGVAAALLWPRSSSSPAGAGTVACLPSHNMVSCAIRF